MARLNEDAQWIILMGFIVSFSLFFLAFLINQSTVVGQSTAEGIIEFPKNDIRDLSSVVIESAFGSNHAVVEKDIRVLSFTRKNAVVNFTITAPNPMDPNPPDTHTYVNFYFNNGVTAYHENWTSL
jgi:hypothetical protein